MQLSLSHTHSASTTVTAFIADVVLCAMAFVLESCALARSFVVAQVASFSFAIQGFWVNFSAYTLVAYVYYYFTNKRRL